MKTTILLAAALSFFSAHATAQHRIFVELGGNGGLFSANYEYAFSPQVGLRVGYGTFVFFSSVPVVATYLRGNGPHYLELGVGVTVGLDADASGDFVLDLSPEESFVIGTGVLGYRYMTERGLMARITLTPFYAEGGVALFAGVSLGFAF